MADRRRVLKQPQNIDYSQDSFPRNEFQNKAEVVALIRFPKPGSDPYRDRNGAVDEYASMVEVYAHPESYVAKPRTFQDGSPVLIEAGTEDQRGIANTSLAVTTISNTNPSTGKSFNNPAAFYNGSDVAQMVEAVGLDPNLIKDPELIPAPSADQNYEVVYKDFPKAGRQPYGIAVGIVAPIKGVTVSNPELKPNSKRNILQPAWIEGKANAELVSNVRQLPVDTYSVKTVDGKDILERISEREAGNQQHLIETTPKYAAKVKASQEARVAAATTKAPASTKPELTQEAPQVEADEPELM